MSEAVFRFDHEAFCVMYCREHSDVVQMVSNLADEHVANMYANGVRERGGYVFKVVSAGVLIAALELIKSPKKPEENKATVKQSLTVEN